MNNLIQYMCRPSEKKTEKDEEYKIIIKKLSGYILEITEELTMYKEFHDEILENGAIQKKFDNYNKTIKDLEIENKELIEQLKKN
jgi:hypothetical protein